MLFFFLFGAEPTENFKWVEEALTGESPTASVLQCR